MNGGGSPGFIYIGRETLFYDMIHPNTTTHPPTPGQILRATPFLEGLEGALTSLKGQVATVEHKMQDRFLFISHFFGSMGWKVYLIIFS